MRFDIFIPLYNKSEYILQLLTTIEQATSFGGKVIVVDDYSTDDSFEKVHNFSKFSDLNLDLYRNEINLGVQKTRSLAFSYSSKDWIMFADADDLLFGDSITELWNKNINNVNDLGVIYGQTAVSRNGVAKVKIINNSEKIIRNFREFRSSVKPTMTGICINRCCEEFLSQSNISWGEDELFYVQVIHNKTILYLPCVFGEYRLVDNSRGFANTSLRDRLSFLTALYQILIVCRSKNNTNFELLYFITKSLRVLLACFYKKLLF